MHRKSDIEYRLTQLTRKLSDLQDYATLVGNGELSIGELLGMPGSMLGRTLNYMGFAQNSAVQYMQANAPYMQQMWAQQGGGNANPQAQQQMNNYIMQQLYWAGRERAQKIEERNLKREEEKIKTEKERQETLLKEVEQELKSAKEARDKGIQDMAPKYVAGQ